MISRARQGLVISLTAPFKFANGYFVRGTDEKGLEMCVTIKDERKKELQNILNIQKGLN